MRNPATLAAVLTLAAASQIGAQPPAGADKPPILRKILLQQDLAMPANYSLALLSIEIAAGAREGRHTHSGALAVYVQEGQVAMEQEGKPPVTYKPGDTIFIEAGKIHEGINVGAIPAKAIATMVAPRGQPMTTQVP